MKISRQEAAQLNPLIDDTDPDGTFGLLGSVFALLQVIHTVEADIHRESATGMYYVLACARAAIEFEKEAPTNGN